MPSTEPEPGEVELRSGAEAGDLKAMYRLANALAERDETDEAERWYRRAADGGSAAGMWGLGDLAESREEYEEAERWFRRSADAGNEAGMCRLGSLLLHRGEFEEAERWLRAALDAGHDHALYCLTEVSDLLGQVDEPVRWYRRLAEAFDLSAETLHIIGRFHEGHGRDEEAESWYLRAAEAGYTRSMSRVAGLLRSRGHAADAARWYQRAYQEDLDGGDSTRMCMLATYLEEAGDLREAESWYRRAADFDDADAMFELGHLLVARGEHDEAERWFRRSVEGDSFDTDLSLGFVLKDGDIARSRDEWDEETYEKVREALDRLPLARLFPAYRASDLDLEAHRVLGSTLVGCGYHGAGMQWYLPPASQGQHRAVSELAEVLLAQDPAEAEAWIAALPGPDEPYDYDDEPLSEVDFTCTLAQVLTSWDRRDTDEPRFRRAADTGRSDAMNWLGVLLDHWGDEAGAEHWYRRAAEAGNHLFAMDNLATLLERQGRRQDARPWRERLAEFRRRQEEDSRSHRRQRDNDDDRKLAHEIVTGRETKLRQTIQERCQRYPNTTPDGAASAAHARTP